MKMTPEQKEAHERMLAWLMVRTITIPDRRAADRPPGPPPWKEQDRDLSPDERAYLCDWLRK